MKPSINSLPGLSRRRFLALTAMGGLVRPGYADDDLVVADQQVRKAEHDAVEKIRDSAADVGVFPLDVTGSEHFLCVGNAPAGFRRKIVQLAEILLDDLLRTLTRSGFSLQPPEERMRIVIFSRLETFRKFAVSVIGPNHTAGFYNTGVNFAAFCQMHRPDGRILDLETSFANAGHELFHSFCFNTGLIQAKSDTPFLVMEGLACQGEVLSMLAPDVLTRSNQKRISQLRDQLRSQGKWFGFADLLTDDATFSALTVRSWSSTVYAQAWLLVHFLLTNPQRRSQFAAYLKSLANRRDTNHRTQDFEAHFGEVSRIESELKVHLAQLIIRPPSKYVSTRRY